MSSQEQPGRAKLWVGQREGSWVVVNREDDKIISRHRTEQEAEITARKMVGDHP